MKCEDFGRFLDNYENLTEQEKSEMTEHAKMCEKCQAELDFFLSMLATMKTLPKIEPPADFMDKLNIRLDAEDERAFRPSRIVYHVRRNWKQYAAAAACFALVATLTANRGIFVDKIDGGDDDIITADTLITDSSGREDAQNAVSTDTEPAVTADENTASDTNADNTGAADNTPSVQSEQTQTRIAQQNTQRVASSTQTTPARQASIASSKASSSVSQPVSHQTTQTTEAAAEAEPVVTEGTQAEEAAETVNTEQSANNSDTPAQSKQNGDYGIALAGSTRTTETASTSYDIRAEDVSASLSAQDIKTSYSIAGGEETIALGRYYRIDKDGNPVEEDSAPKAIGSLKISSSDADKAMEVIRKYPHGEDGDLYTTDYEYFSLMLSMLSSEGVSYTNYTPAGSGDVKFRIVFN